MALENFIRTRDGNLDAVFETSVTAFGSVPAAFAVVLTTTGFVGMFVFANSTDKEIQLSFDNTNVHLALPAGQTLVLPLDANSRCESDNVSIRYVAAPTVGNVTLTAIR